MTCKKASPYGRGFFEYCDKEFYCSLILFNLGEQDAIGHLLS